MQTDRHNDARVRMFANFVDVLHLNCDNICIHVNCIEKYPQTHWLYFFSHSNAEIPDEKSSFLKIGRVYDFDVLHCRNEYCYLSKKRIKVNMKFPSEKYKID